jgi:hypothetical protein
MAATSGWPIAYYTRSRLDAEYCGGDRLGAALVLVRFPGVLLSYCAQIAEGLPPGMFGFNRSTDRFTITLGMAGLSQEHIPKGEER